MTNYSEPDTIKWMQERLTEKTKENEELKLKAEYLRRRVKELEESVRVNSVMLARQCDLALEAETMAESVSKCNDSLREQVTNLNARLGQHMIEFSKLATDNDPLEQRVRELEQQNNHMTEVINNAEAMLEDLGRPEGELLSTGIISIAAERDALKIEYESRVIWIKKMNDILGYDNSDGFHSEPDPFEIARNLKAERDRLKQRVDELQDKRDLGFEVVAMERDRLQEWRDSVSGAIKNIPEFHSGEWGGDKEGWGYHFEVVNWLVRERDRLQDERAVLQQRMNDYAASNHSYHLQVEELCAERNRAQKIYEQRTELIDSLTKENELLRFSAGVRQKMLHYVAFVLTGDENADAQLAVDRISERIKELEAELEKLKWEEQP